MVFLSSVILQIYHFKDNAFDGTVSLHTIHHLPPEDHIHAYQELYRTLAPSGKGVIVNGWDNPPLTVFLNIWISLADSLFALLHHRSKVTVNEKSLSPSDNQTSNRGTYIRKHNASWLHKEVGSLMPLNIWCWRSVSVRFLRTFIHDRFAGKILLNILYWKEELFPHLLGMYGQYPLIELSKNK